MARAGYLPPGLQAIGPQAVQMLQRQRQLQNLQEAAAPQPIAA